MSKATQRFSIFEAECRRLQKLWGLNDWHVYVRHASPDSKDARASCRASSVKRAALVRLNPNPGKSEEGEDPKLSARHEMIHVLLGEMSCLLGSRWVTSDEAEAAEEALTQRLIRLLP